MSLITHYHVPVILYTKFGADMSIGAEAIGKRKKPTNHPWPGGLGGDTRIRGTARTTTQSKKATLSNGFQLTHFRPHPQRTLSDDTPHSTPQAAKARKSLSSWTKMEAELVILKSTYSTIKVKATIPDTYDSTITAQAKLEGTVRGR
ncbi:hypothetical protein BDZ91DRAFT_803305 [Kalaharituber pfeilii]|nr:hypothetical protein BDZ91DRAFT_803305 [Kalaharituber pfeilii]